MGGPLFLFSWKEERKKKDTLHTLRLHYLYSYGELRRRTAPPALPLEGLHTREVPLQPLYATFTEGRHTTTTARYRNYI